MTTRSIIRPAARGVVRSPLGGDGSASVDEDAAAYIAAVQAAGVDEAHLSSAGLPSWAVISEAIDNWYAAEKLAGRYSLLRRVRFPIWADEVANEIDMISLAHGSYVGSVTHGSGWSQGDGSSGYFNFETSFVAEGLSLASAYIFGLLYTDLQEFAALLGAGAASSQCTVRNYYPKVWQARWADSGAGQVSVDSTGVESGIISFSREGGNRSIYRRTAVSRTTLVANASSNNGVVSSSDVVSMAHNNSSNPSFVTPGSHSTAKHGMDGFGLGMTDAQDAEFTSGIKALWENCTGLSLPGS